MRAAEWPDEISPYAPPQTSSAISTRRASLIHWSASERSLPCAVEEKPHWWLSAHWPRGTYSSPSRCGA